MRRIITLRQALYDLLKDEGVSIDDLLTVMDDNPQGIIESLMKRVNITLDEAISLEKKLSSKQLNILLFAIHVFYIVNTSGYYKDFLIYPPRDLVIGPDGKVTKEGLNLIIRSLKLDYLIDF